jgi:AraC-like DNA-binding protein
MHSGAQPEPIKSCHDPSPSLALSLNVELKKRTIKRMSMKRHSDVNALLRTLGEAFTGEVVFDEFHDTVYFIKNSHGQYLVVNQTLADRCGLKHKSQLLGRTSEEVLPPPLGSSFTQQDRKLLRSGMALTGQLELHIYPSGGHGWCITNKHPLTDKQGKTIGLVGVSRDLGHPDQRGLGYEILAKAIQYANKNLSRSIKVTELVELTGLSRFQMDRRMRIAFGLTTGQWLLKARIDLARNLLQTSQIQIVDIAHKSGYADQSAFSRQFRRVTGLTPHEYRQLRSKPQ